jgi:hypothetical protein
MNKFIAISPFNVIVDPSFFIVHRSSFIVRIYLVRRFTMNLLVRLLRRVL